MGRYQNKMKKEKAAAAAKVEYQFRTPWFYKDVDPNAAAQELLALKAQKSELVPEDVVEFAKDPKTTLHNCFEWDDTEAAIKYRLHQARTLILNIQVVVNKKPPQRLFVHISTPEERTYEEVTLVTKDGADVVMANAVRDLRAWVDRYEELRNRLPGVFAAASSVIASYNQVPSSQPVSSGQHAAPAQTSTSVSP